MKELTDINIDNYESWFLLFADGELSDTKKLRALIDFVEKHPHLKRELDVLLATINKPDETIVFDNKDVLLKISDETLMLYLDKELSPEDERWVETLLPKGFEHRLADLKKVYTQPDESIVLTNKEKLYRQTIGRRLSLVWPGAAAAAVFIGFLVVLYFSLYTDKTGTPVAAGYDVADIKKDTVKPLEVASSQAAQSPEVNFPKLLKKEADKKSSAIHIARTKTNRQKEEKVVPDLKESDKKLMPKSGNEYEGVKISNPADKAAFIVQAEEIKPQQPSVIASVKSENIIVARHTGNTAQGTASAIKRKKSLLKNIGNGIKNRALDILANGSEDVTVAGFAVNLHR